MTEFLVVLEKKENGPRTINDLTLINAGKILENTGHLLIPEIQLVNSLEVSSLCTWLCALLLQTKRTLLVTSFVELLQSVIVFRVFSCVADGMQFKSQLPGGEVASRNSWIHQPDFCYFESYRVRM
ncbi:hypothetical protein ACFX2I_044267 [Malus domestica]